MVIVTVKLTEEEIDAILIYISKGATSDRSKQLKKDFQGIKDWIDEAKERRVVEMNKVNPKKEYIEKIKGELDDRDNKSWIIYFNADSCRVDYIYSMESEKITWKKKNMV